MEKGKLIRQLNHIMNTLCMLSSGEIMDQQPYWKHFETMACYISSVLSKHIIIRKFEFYIASTNSSKWLERVQNIVQFDGQCKGGIVWNLQGWCSQPTSDLDNDVLIILTRFWPSEVGQIRVSGHAPANALDEWPEIGMLMYPDHRQDWLTFGHGN